MHRLAIAIVVTLTIVQTAIAQEKKQKDPFPVETFVQGPDDRTGDAIFRGKTVEFRRLQLAAGGTFYEVWINGKLISPNQRRANGLLIVEIPWFGKFKCPKDLREEMYRQGFLEVRTFSRPRRKPEPAKEKRRRKRSESKDALATEENAVSLELAAFDIPVSLHSERVSLGSCV